MPRKRNSRPRRGVDNPIDVEPRQTVPAAGFAALLERKLGAREPGRRTWHLVFSSWDREGPRVEARPGTVEEIPHLLRQVA